MPRTSSQDFWIQVGTKALSVVDQLLDSKKAEKFKKELRKCLADARRDPVAAAAIKRLLEQSPATRNWTKRQVASMKAKSGQAAQKRMLDSLATMAIQEVKKSGVFVIPGLGRLVRVDRKARMGRNPATGEAIGIPAKKVVKFRVAKAVKNAIVPAKGKKPIKKRAARIRPGLTVREGKGVGHLGRSRSASRAVPSLLPGDGAARVQAETGARTVEKPFATVQVFYGTDRKPTGQKKPDKFFAADRGELNFGSVEVSIPHDHRTGELEGRVWWKLQFRKNPAKHVVVVSLQVLGRKELLQSFRKSFRQQASKEVLLFVHGYNVSFEDACRRTAQIAYDLDFGGVPALYSWPSEGKAKLYFVDETNVQWSVPHFREFLSLLLIETGASAVHVIAHSMGNRALVEALRTFDVKVTPGSAQLTQVVFAAPDIDAATFQEIVKEFRKKAARFTLYASSKDVALKASKAFHKYPRAGDSGKGLVLCQGIDTIDATNVDTGLIGHSYIGDNDSILADVYDLVREGSPPPRFRLRRREQRGREYWMFQR